MIVTLDSILWKHVRCQAPLLTEELLCLRDVGVELARLRGIERAVTEVSHPDTTREAAIVFWRMWEQIHPVHSAGVGLVIASALEKRRNESTR